MIPPDPRTAVESLRSTICPHCGKLKKVGQTLCYRAYIKLPQAMKGALYDRLGEGYEQAVAEALNYLGVKTFIKPGYLA